MKALYKCIMTALVLLAGVSCKMNREEPPVGENRYVITSSIQSLKTVLGGDRHSVLWEEGDRVAIISYNAGSGTWASLTDLAPSSVSEASASFSFSLDPGFEPVFISFPSRSSSAYNTTLGGVLTQIDNPLYLVQDNLPLASKAAAVSLANTSLGVISDGAASMQNALSLLKITLTAPRISRMVLSGNAGESLSGGPVFVPESMVLAGWMTPAETLELLPQNGDCFESGTYYVPFVPQRFASGITLTLTDNTGGVVVKSSVGDFTFLRNRVYNLGTAGSTLVITDLGSEAFQGRDEGGALNQDDPLRDAEDQSDTLSIDIIPDFSRVGYKYGDVPIPTLPVVRTIGPDDVAAALAAGTAADTTSFIQAKLDEVAAAGGGALLLRNGEYHVGDVLFIDHDNTVLRGESEAGTVLVAEGTRRRPVIWLGACVNDRAIRMSYTTTGDFNNERVSIAMFNPSPSSFSIDYSKVSVISEDYVPAGRLWLRVDDPEFFSPGDRVAIVRPGTAAWISDIGMDKIDEKLDQIHPTTQWDPADYQIEQERRITWIRGDKIGLDAPVMMSLDRKYSKCFLAACSWPRVTGSGVEHLTINVAYNPSLVYTSGSYEGQYYDEDHAWYSISIAPAEHCWVRHVTSMHHGLSMIYFRQGSRLCTAEYCTSTNPVSIVRGSRRYAFYFTSRSCQNLVQHCTCDHDRHATVTGGSRGPNVFYDVTCTTTYSVQGPHLHWGIGTLYDNVTTDNDIEIIDRGNSGGNHGWAGVTEVLWNCTAAGIAAQSPWTSAYNYAVGCVGEKVSKGTSYSATTDYYRSRGIKRPDARWYPERAYWSTGGTKVSLPVADPGVDWWPRLTLGAYSHPESLYLSQLEDRHARGIYLTTL